MNAIANTVMPQVEAVPIALIDPSPFQKRRKFRDINELAANISANGLLQPSTVRRVGERFQLVFGERRKRACEKLGWEDMPAFVREMSDEEAAIASATENLERDNLEPVEEAESVQVLRDRGWTLEQIAEKTGHSVRWVARLASLTQLSAKWMKMVQDENQAVSGWTAMHLALIARFPPEVQDSFHGDFKAVLGTYDYERRARMTVKALEHDLGQHLLALSGARWKKEDAELLPAAGACTTCKKRSDCQPELFEDDESEGGKKKKKTKAARCLDSSCWDKKLLAHLKNVEAQLRNEYGQVIKLSDRWTDTKGVTQVHALEKVKAGAEGAVPGLFVEGSDKGSVVWVRVGGKSSAASVKPVKSLSERKRDYDWRRLRRIIAKLADLFEQLYGSRDKPGTAPVLEHLSDGEMLGLVAAFGTKHCNTNFRPWYVGGLVPFKEYHRWVEDGAEGLIESLFRQACGVIETALRSNGNTQFANMSKQMQAECVKNVKECAALLEFEWGELWSEAEAAIPYPKSWEKLTRDGKPAQGAK